MKRFMLLVMLVLTCPALAQETGPAQKAGPAPDQAAGRWALNMPDKAPAFTLVRLVVDNPGDRTFDVLVMGVQNSMPNFPDVVQVLEDDERVDEFVFTAPPGQYAVRITTSCEPGTRPTVTTRNIEILPPSGVVGPGPVDPGNPPSEPTDSNLSGAGKPPPEGMYGFGPVVFENVLKVPGGAPGATKLLENYEWAVNSDLPLNELLDELSKRNESAYQPASNWKPYRDALNSYTKELVDENILPANEITDWKIVFKEVVSGLRAALNSGK